MATKKQPKKGTIKITKGPIVGSVARAGAAPKKPRPTNCCR